MVRGAVVRSFGVALTVLALTASLGPQLYAGEVYSIGAASIVAAPGDKDQGKSSGSQGSSGSVSGGQQGSQQGNSSTAGGSNTNSGNSGSNSGNSGVNNGNSGSSGGNSGNNGNSGAGQSGQQGNGPIKDEPRNPNPPGNDKSAGNGANALPDGRYTSDPAAPPTASNNGLGGGNSIGRPQAGSVGNADDKNPPGQVSKPEPGGYECKNNGNALGNPAHTPIDCSGQPATGDGGTGNDPGNGTNPGTGTNPGNGDGTGNGNNPGNGNGNSNGNGSGNGNGGGSGNGNSEQPGTRTETSIGMSPVDAPEESAETAIASAPEAQAMAPRSPAASAQNAPGVVAGSAPAQAPEVLGQIPSVPVQGADGQLGVQQEIGLGVSAAALQPAVLPYTGDADEASSLPAIWMAAGLLLTAAGLFFRRGSTLETVRNK